MKYYEFETTKHPISYYLAKEEYLLTKGEESFFVWNNLPGIVIGKNQVLEDEVNILEANKDGIPIYRRKSGGGAVYSDDGCFMFTFIVKKAPIDQIYSSYLRKIYKIINLAGYKCEIGERNDLLIKGAKFSGTSIYLKNNFAIFHGTILFDSNLKDMGKYLTPNKEKLAKNKVASVASRVINLKEYIKYDKDGLMDLFQKTVGNIKGRLYDSEIKVIEKISLKYEDKKWLEGNLIPYTYKVQKCLSVGNVIFMAKVYKKVIEEVRISGDFFENNDVKYLENQFLGAKLDRIDEVIDGVDVSKYIYGLTSEEFRLLFITVEAKKKVSEQKTCLYDNHVRHGGKIVEFGGFLMPIEYTGITNEHHAVRNNAGVFDCSHMGEIKVSGPDTLDFLNFLLTSNVKGTANNHMIYGLLLYENGTVVDDMMVYKVSDNECMLVVNASNTAKDFEYIKKHIAKFNVSVENLSAKCGELALQGPKAIDYLRKMTSFDLDSLKFFDFAYIEIDDMMFNISRSGYTGSDGFEIYGKNQDIITLFEDFASAGVTLCGLGCRDTLRFEAAMPLYGHEISDELTPIEAGLNYAIDFEKGDFLGRDALLKQKENGLKKKLVGIELLERGIARGGYKLYKNNNEIGYITTGYMIPETNNAYALGYVDTNYSKIGEEIDVQIRNHLVRARVRNKKFLKKDYVK